MGRLSLYWRAFHAVTQNPRYFYFILRNRRHEEVARELAKGRPPADGTFYPVKLDLRIVYGCNLRCRMCGQWGETGTYFGYDAAKLKRKLDLSVIERVARELVPHGLRYVDMEGGETFLHPEIMPILTTLKSLGLFVKPVTNGTLLAKFARELVEARVDAVHVSVDGDRQAHNFVRGAEWAYDRTMEGLRALAEERRRAGRRVPFIQVSFTMTRHNRAESLLRLCEELAGQDLLDVLAVKANPIWLPKGMGEMYDRLVQKYFGTNGTASWKGFVEDYRDFGDQAREIARTIDHVKSNGYDFFVESVPKIPSDQIPRLYTDYGWNLGRTHCPIAYTEPTIDADGNVYPCNLFTDESLSMGNVHDGPFLDIWFGERFRTFRRMLAEQGGLLPICNRCCQLTEH